MHDDEYLALETQYDALVESVNKCHETINQLSTRIDQQNVRLAEFVHKLSVDEAIALGMAVKDLFKAVRYVEEQLDDVDVFGKLR